MIVYFTRRCQLQNIKVINRMKKIPAIDIGICTKCEGCIEVAPQIFRYNDAAGYIEVIDLEEYSEEDVDEAIKICPVDCIFWEKE